MRASAVPWTQALETMAELALVRDRLQAGLIAAVVLACIGCRPQVRPVESPWVRLQVVRIHPDHSPEGILAILAKGGSFDHVVLVHTPQREEMLFRRWDAALAAAVIGSWYPAGGGEPWSEAAAWARGAREGEVSPPLLHGGATYLLRLAERLEPGAPLAAGSFHEVFAALGKREFRDAVQHGRIRLRVGASEILAGLEEGDLARGDWSRNGPRWVVLARALGSDALAMRVLAVWSEFLVREHRLREAAALSSDLLGLAEKHRLSERARALVARRLAAQYAHARSPFAALEILGRQRRILRGEGLYIVLCALAERFEDLGLVDPASSLLDEAAQLASQLRHLHGPNHHLIRGRLLLAAGRKDQARQEARAAEGFALTRMHLRDHIEAGIFTAQLLVETGDPVEAEHLGTMTVRRCQAYEEMYGDHVCTLPALWVTWEARRARGDEAGAREIETEMLAEAGRGHSALAMAEVDSLLAASLLPEDPARGAELLFRALDLTHGMKANHIALEARLAFLDWSLTSGRERDRADQLADELFRSFEDLRDSHLPLLPTPQKRDEVTALSALLSYYLGTGAQTRAVRVAERIAAASAFRSLLVLAASPERLAPMALVSASDEPPSDLSPSPLPMPATAGAAAGRQRLERFALGLLDTLEGEEPYPYAEVLEPGDLFLSYHLAGGAAYVLSWFAGETRVELLASCGEPPAARITRLREAVSDLGSDDRRSLAGYRAAEEAYQLLLGGQRERLRQATRLVVSPGPDLETLPFGLLRSGGRELAMRLPILYVETGLPIAAQDLAGTAGAPDRSALLFVDPGGDLPATRAAMAALAHGRPEVHLRAGKRATESALWAVRGRPAVLHLDTHARLQPRGGLQQVVVQLAPGGGDDGELLLREWLLRLEARPEVLSIVACRSGVAAGASRDLARLGGCSAVLGIRWVLTTFWRVEEKPSACFAARWLARVLAGERPDRALHRTILHLEKSCSESDLSVWAPFRLSMLGGTAARSEP